MFSFSIPRKQKKPFTTTRLLFIPSKLTDLPAFLTNLGKNSRYINDHQDKVAYILHKIHERQAFNSYNETGGFVNLKHDVLAQVIGKRYVKPILSMLIDASIIECDGYFIEGVKALGYRIADAYRSKVIGLLIFKPEVLGRKLELRVKYKRAAIRKDTLLYKIDKDIRQIRIHYEAACQLNSDIYEATQAFLHEHHTQLHTHSLIKCDYRRLLDLASMHDHIRLPSVKDLRKSMKFHKELIMGDVLQRNSLDAYCANLISIEKIHNQDFHPPKRPVPDSRVYTNLTNLSSSFRQYLYHVDYPEETLYNIDIKNSQPFLVSILLHHEYRNDMPEDAQRYVRDTSSGRFYERVSALMGTPLRDVCETDSALVKAQKLRERKEFKQAFFSNIFFCENIHTEGSKAWSVFQEEYPTVAALIQEAKRQDYRALANRMQYVEAQIILEKVVRKLQKQKVWCSSIHDSIVCLKHDKEAVMSTMLNAFQTAFNLCPGLNEEPLCK